jgi:glycosyltransferase involved in cell wall biosynthesis
MKKPLFSIIVATHKRPVLLQRCLESIRSQNFQDFEIIVVIDTVDARSFEIVSQLIRDDDIFIKHNGEYGPASSRNLGLDAAKGEWIVFLDDDDRFADIHFYSLKTAIDQHPHKNIFYCDARIVIEDRIAEIPSFIDEKKIFISNNDINSIWVKNFIPNNCLAFKREQLCRIYFDEKLKSLEDWDFLLAACHNTMPFFYQGDGPIVHKDYKNMGNRRGTTQEAQGLSLVLDYLYIYKKRPAPLINIKQKRANLLKDAGYQIDPLLL